jgi:DNA replication protein DnaC
MDSMSGAKKKRSCKLCKGDTYLLSVAGEFAHAQRCECTGSCPDCLGTGMVVNIVDEDRVASPCRCNSLDRRIQLFNDAHVPGKFMGSWIEDLEETHRSQTEIKYRLLKYRESYRPTEAGFLLWGEPGVAKTHLLCGLIGYLTLERGISCRFIEFMRLIMDLKQAYSKGEWDSAVIAPLLGTDVLVIDELGKGRNSDFELDILDQLISSRYNAKRTIHCTSNYSPDDAGRRPGDLSGGIEKAIYGQAGAGLKERVGDRIFSRLHEMCRFVQVQGTDFRTHRNRRVR